MFSVKFVTQVEQESKEATEDLLAQQFSGKSIDKENVELLRSLLNGNLTYRTGMS